MTAIADAVTDLREALPVAAALTAYADTAAHGDGWESAPPWNAAAAHALYGALAAIADAEAMLRYAITGRTGRRRHASHAGAALDAILSLSHAAPGHMVGQVTRDLNRCTMEIHLLAAVDKLERPMKITYPCPYCGLGMLRVLPRAGEVRCLRFGVCFDGDGRLPVGLMDVGLAGPQVHWADGRVTP
jgi:hypothetical protein